MKAYGEVLIVDDSSTSRMIIQRCMQMAGFVVDRYSFAGNGLEAMSMLKAGHFPELVVTDINMPKMDGRALANLLKREAWSASIPIIVVSSLADSAFETELKSLGVLAVVKKPVSPAKILEALGGEP